MKRDLLNGKMPDTDLVLVKELKAKNGSKIGHITLNSEETLNSLTLSMVDIIHSQLREWEKEKNIVAVILEGAGDKAFASGADISQFKERRSNADAAEEYARISMAGRQKMLHCEKPFIAQIRGFCMGGGLGIALAADIRIASEDAQFGVPAARLSIAYDRLNLGNLVGLVGPSKAKEILLSLIHI